MKKSSEKEKRRPTLLQLQYLIEWEKLGGNWGDKAAVAEICGVKHNAVNYFFKQCQEWGYMTEDSRLTESGKAWLNGYRDLIEGLEEYLLEVGIPEYELRENIASLIENTDSYTLSAMVRGYQEKQKEFSVKQSEENSWSYLNEIMQYGECDVQFSLHRIDGAEGRHTTLSMANRGFEKPGKLLQEEGKSFLELRLRNMKANSRISGRAMKGHLSSLRYIYHGNLKEVEFQEGKIRIPLEICRFHREKNGRIEGMLAVTVTCSVGMSHMPESTAMLYFTL